MKKTASFSTKIDLKLRDKLREDLESQGLTFTRPPYTLFSAQKKGLTCILYESGSLVVQGKEKEAFIEFYLEPEILQNLKYSHPELYVNLVGHIGVDESGKGDFFGPLCIAGCFAEEQGIKKLVEMGIKDSKRLSDPMILRLAKEIKASFPHTIIRLFPQKYNELYQKFKNLNYLLGWAHATVIAELSIKTHCQDALIDQFADKSVVENALKKKNLSVRLEQRTHAEADPVVAAASILAREAFIEGLKILENEINFPLPKGASAAVSETGRKLVNTFGPDILNKVAKTHFKTKEEILQSLNL
ncbi:MAG: ribonuclease HIII [Chlamydiota bacterium]